MFAILENLPQMFTFSMTEVAERHPHDMLKICLGAMYQKGF